LNYCFPKKKHYFISEILYYIQFSICFNLPIKRTPHLQEPTPLSNEKGLLLLISEGDEEAFRQLFHYYSPLLYPMILKVIKVENVTHDIIQDTFLRLWLNRDKLPEIENPKAWILRIAYYRAFTFLRQKSIHQKATGLIVERDGLSTLRNDTEELVSFRQTTALIKKAVYSMPDRQKKVYQLSRENGYKIDEIASELNLSKQSVKNTLGRALKFIREYLIRSGHGLFVLILDIFLFR
jgi:RNA polymerase sigma-70 factor (family 1)